MIVPAGIATASWLAFQAAVGASPTATPAPVASPAAPASAAASVSPTLDPAPHPVLAGVQGFGERLVQVTGVGDRSRSLVFIPRARYSTTAGFGGGLEVLSVFKGTIGGREAPPSKLSGQYLHSERDYVKAELVAQVATPDDRLAFKTKFEYRHHPERFYGLGPESRREDEEIYVPVQVRFYAELFTCVTEHLDVGVRYEFDDVVLDEIESDGRLAEGEIRGSTGSSIAGVGLLATYDTRDDGWSPTRGAYHEAAAYVFHDREGSETDFGTGLLDLRFYRPWDERVVAFQAFTYGVTRRAPFTRLAALGGRHHSRGYRRGRYLDRMLVATQAELRFPVQEGFEGALFAGVASVAGEAHDFALDTIRPTIGVGVRRQIRSTPRIKIGVDAAFGLSGPRFYLRLGEAF